MSYLKEGLLIINLRVSSVDSPCLTKKYRLCNRDGRSMNACAGGGVTRDCAVNSTDAEPNNCARLEQLPGSHRVLEDSDD